MVNLYEFILIKKLNYFLYISVLIITLFKVVYIYLLCV